MLSSAWEGIHSSRGTKSACETTVRGDGAITACDRSKVRQHGDKQPPPQPGLGPGEKGGCVGAEWDRRCSERSGRCVDANDERPQQECFTVADDDADEVEEVASRGTPPSKQHAIRGRGNASVAHIDAASNVRPRLLNNPGIRRLVQMDLIAAADPEPLPRTSYRKSRPDGNPLRILNHTSLAGVSNGPIIGSFTEEARDMTSRRMTVLPACANAL